MSLSELKIVVDARMIKMSGIGRYTQALIPTLVAQFKEVVLLGNPADFSGFDWHHRVSVVPMYDPIYSLKEQLSLLLKTPFCDLFLAPHYNAPLVLPQAKKVAVIIPDVNHLVFRKELSAIKGIYASLFYNCSARKDLVFTISDFSRDELVRFTHVDPRKITVAKCAIDTDHFGALKARLSSETSTETVGFRDTAYVLYIGNLKPHKNLKRALLAFRKVAENRPQLKFLIVGKRDNFLTGENEIFGIVDADLFLKERVAFTGHLSDLGLAWLYANAALFLFPSLYEGFGLPPLEAMYFGCPVIVSREGSLPEICGDAAGYCNAYDENSIAAAAEAVLSDTTLRQSLSDKGFRKVNEYSWGSFNETIIGKLKAAFE